MSQHQHIVSLARSAIIDATLSSLLVPSSFLITPGIIILLLLALFKVNKNRIGLVNAKFVMCCKKPTGFGTSQYIKPWWCVPSYAMAANFAEFSQYG